MYENNKALLVRPDGATEHAVRARPLYNVERVTIRLHRRRSLETAAPRTAMEAFATAVAQLLKCGSCYVAVLSHANAPKLDQAAIGQATADPGSAKTVARLAQKGAGANCAIFEPKNTRSSFTRKILGSEPGEGDNSVVGRFTSGDAATVVFVAGWRSAALLPAEIPCLRRAVRTIWETANGLAQPSHRNADSQIWLKELSYAAFIADEDLQIHELNDSARALLLRGEILKENAGRLTGVGGSVTEGLKEAIRRTLRSRSGQGWLTVPLSTEHQQFAFAKIGVMPPHCDVGKVLVIVPQFDEVSGANRIASAFGLNWAEERIIARVLQGQGPRRIGTDLRLTEATVRTYIKRIMLKLGINRQSEFFLLYHLTQSPFGADRREERWLHEVPDAASRKAH